MKNKFSTIYAIFASILFVLTIIYFSFNLYSEYSNGYIRTKKSFDQLTLNLKKNPERFEISNLNDYASLELLQNGVSFYVFPSKSAVDNTSSSKLIKNWTVSTKIGDNNYFINANMYLLRPSSIRFYARNSFIIVFIITLITIILIITISIDEKEVQKSENQNPTDDLNEENKIIKEKNNSFDLETDSSLKNQVDTNKIVTLEEKENHEIINLPQNESSTLKIKEIENEKLEKPTLPSDEVKPTSINPEDNNPYGLFSPKSGIGWESYLLTRLDNELNRAISSEFDMAVFVIKIIGIENDDEKFKQVCDYLTIQFQFKDMLFEYKEDCIVAIKVSMNLDEAISFADKLHTDMEDITALSCFIGISTRTIRIISGERILQEAEEALNHAQQEKDTPIIAFRANAEKYREYLENNK